MSKTSPKPDAPTVMPIAISYLRFSSLEQRKGDSTRRQTEGADAWCEREGIRLDDSFRLKDRGKSAFSKARRKDDDGMAGLPDLDELVNPDRRALAGFLELIRQRKIPRGSYLIIENLDRLSRDDVVPATHLLLTILVSGVKVVTLSPRELVLTDKADMGDVMLAVVELSRGNSESKAKSYRSLANWEKALLLAREGKPMPPRRKDGKVERVITKRLPAWISVKEGVPELIPERADVVRRLFEWAKQGFGIGTIVKKLGREKVPAFGACEVEEDEDGVRRRKKSDATPFGCGEWRTSYVRDILTDRRAIGEFQPRHEDGTPNGDPIPGYYPAVVTEADFFAARAATLARKNRGADRGATANRQGRIGEGVANLFGGLLRDSRDGDTYYVATRDEGGVRSRVLLNRGSIERPDVKAYTFPYDAFEAGILSCLRELEPGEVLGNSPQQASAAAVRGELDWVREKKAELSAELLKGDVAAIADALRQLAAREAELVAKLDDAEEEAAKPIAETWRDAQDLAKMLERVPADQREDVRLRLRAAIRRLVDSIWVLVVPRGMDRLAAVQVYFARGGHRSYLIVRRRAQANPGQKRRDGTTSEPKRKPALWAVASAVGWGLGGDLRRRTAGIDEEGESIAGADDVEQSLLTYPLDVIEQMLAKGHPLP